MINYYEVLEVSEKASKEVIEKAHKALAKKYHPDLNHDNSKEAEQKMKEINEAYEVLMDDAKRSNFDSVLAKKRELEQRKASHSSESQSSNDLNKQFNNYNKISYSNGYYTDPNDNFFINTKNMDEKTRKKLQNKLQERYLEAYDSYLRERGYKLKYKWTFKRVCQVALAILITFLVCVVLFFIPPIHDYLVDLYNENIAIKLIVDLVRSIFSAIFSVFG